jgi:hypothetical protein
MNFNSNPIRRAKWDALKGFQSLHLHIALAKKQSFGHNLATINA